MKKLLFTLVLMTAIAVSSFYVAHVQAQDIEGGLLVTVGETSGVLFSDPATQVIAAKFVRQIDILRKVKLDTKFLQSDEFTSLIDWSRPLPEEEAGRSNPFAPF